jgi:phenylacetate-CoA ligase
MVSSFRLSREQLPLLLEQVRAFDPQVAERWPSSITILASLLRDRGERLPVTAVITCSEVITAEQLRFMREVFGGPVVDHYGQTERVVNGS